MVFVSEKLEPSIEVRLIRLHEDQTKNAEARNVPVPAVLVMLLKDMKPKTGRVFDDTNLRAEWAKACTSVGLGRTIKRKGESGNLWFQYSGLIVRPAAFRNSQP